MSGARPKQPSPYSKYWKKRAMKLFMAQFHNQPCAICGSYAGTVGHHLLPKGCYADYALDEQNILVLCPTHHMFSNEIAAHSMNSLAVSEFVRWVKENRPEKHEWMQQHKNVRSGKKINYKKLYEELCSKESPGCSTKKDSTASSVKTAFNSLRTRTT